MTTPNNAYQGFPIPGSPLVILETGRVTEVWNRFFLSVWGFLAYAVSTGDIKAIGGTVPASGWLLCNGAAVSRTVYKNLFSIIGTTYGAGDGSTTFNLPHLGGSLGIANWVIKT